MADSDHWNNKILVDHPIFSLPKASIGTVQNSLELSANTLTNFTNVDTRQNSNAPSGRRQTMILKDTDIIVAVGKEIRMSSFGDIKLSRSIRKSYKTLFTPTVQFEIHQISLNPSGKLLAVAGAFQVAVIVLPRTGYSRLVPETIDCKAVQVGQFYHAATSSPAIAKIDWHPWGEAGSTLLVMTIDGNLREYDISVDTENPQQVINFIPEKKSKSFMAEDDAEREVASFTLGKGKADWGPLTVYAVMKSGDIYSICPYMPRNASIPSAYVHSLECFIAVKQDFISHAHPTVAKNLSSLYDYQRKYVTGLIRQLPPGTVFPGVSRSVPMHPPTTISLTPMRQGPFLLQPSPAALEGSEGGDATDITYLAFGVDDDGDQSELNDTEHLGVLLVAYQDGKVDLFLDVEKVEPRWSTKKNTLGDLPMFAVYESIDIGLIQTLKDASPSGKPHTALELLQANHPVFLLDPLHDDVIYVYHAFGVHALDIAPVLQALAAALHSEDDDDRKLQANLQNQVMTNVQPILNTFSIEHNCSSPVVAVAIPNDVYLTYSIFILTSMMRINSFPLNLRASSPKTAPKLLPPLLEESRSTENNKWFVPLDGPPTYVSLLQNSRYKPPPSLSGTLQLPTVPKQSLPSGSREFVLTPDTLRYIGTVVGQISSQIHDLHLAYRTATARSSLHKQELARMTLQCKELDRKVELIKGPKQAAIDDRIIKIQDEQKMLLGRLDHLLQGMMEKASPSLSEHETKWFEELKRMKDDVMGSGKYDEDSLVARIRLLEREYARLLPALKTLAEKEQERSKQRSEHNGQLGFSQAFEYGEKSNHDQTRINALKKQVSSLATTLDIPLSRPPQ